MEITLKTTAMNVKVSVIIPVYNVELYLEECLDSVLSQSLRDIEVILVNDGSTDRSFEIIENYAKNDNRIQVLNQDNKGVSAARNIGLSISRGEYILFVDSDDMIIENSLDLLYKQACEKNTEVLLGHAYRYFTNGEKIDFFYNRKKLDKDEVTDGKVLYSRLMEKSIFPPLVYLFFCKKDFLDKYDIRFKEGIIHEDELWCVKVIYQAKKITCTSFYTYLYRHREGSIMNSNNYKYRIDSMSTVVKDLCVIADNLNTSNKELECSGWIYIRVFWLFDQIGILSRLINTNNSEIMKVYRILIQRIYKLLTYRQQQICLAYYKNNFRILFDCD